MITDAIINFFGGIFDWLLGTLPVIESPQWLNAGAAMTGTVFGYAASMGAWFPSGLLLTVVGLLLATWLISWGVHVARMVLSMFTGGGGKA